MRRQSRACLRAKLRHPMDGSRPHRSWTIWALAFGYFACYAPYSALTKAMTKGLFPSLSAPIVGFTLLPVTVFASVVGMFTFLTTARWWRYAGRKTLLGKSVPSPNRWTLLSGLATAAVIGTTTLAYTFDGVSIVFVMLLMRGGVLILAPIVDTLSKRRTRWFSWAGLLLSLASLVVAFSESGGYEITLICAIDVAIYLASYFLRLRFMSRLAKSKSPEANRRYFVEEQMVASPAMFLLLVLVALWGQGEIALAVRAGFTTFLEEPILGEAILIGLLSQGTGIFGGLILLDPSENTYSVPVNRCSSILAGVVAAGSLAVVFSAPAPSMHQLVGAGLIVMAILFLTLPKR